MSKKLVTLSVAVLTALSTVSIVGLASADSTTPATKHHHHRIHWGARLDQAVRDGTITSTQKAAFKAELKTLHTERKKDITKSSTAAERKAEHAKLKQLLQAWASANNFPLSKLVSKAAS